MLIITNYRLEGFVHKVDFSNIQKPHAVMTVGVAAAAVAVVAFTIALVVAAVFIPPIGAFLGATFVASSVATVSISLLVGFGATAIAIVTLLKAREMFKHRKEGKDPAESKPSESKQDPSPKPKASSPSSKVIFSSSSDVQYTTSEPNLSASLSPSPRRSVSTSTLCIEETPEETQLYQTCLNTLLKIEKEKGRKLRQEIEDAKEDIVFQERQKEIDELAQDIEALEGDLGYGPLDQDEEAVALADQDQRVEETHEFFTSVIMRDEEEIESLLCAQLEKDMADYDEATAIADEIDDLFQEYEEIRRRENAKIFIPDQDVKTVHPILTRKSAQYLMESENLPVFSAKKLNENPPKMQDGLISSERSHPISISSLRLPVGVFTFDTEQQKSIADAKQEAIDQRTREEAAQDPHAAVWDIDTDSSSSSTSSLQGSPQVTPPPHLSPPKQVTPAEDLSPASHNLSDGSFEHRLRSALGSLPTTTIVQEERRAEAELETIIGSGNPPSPKPPSPPVSPTLSERAVEVFLSGGMGQTQEAEPALLPKCAKYEGLLTFINKQLLKNDLPAFEIPKKPEILNENYLGTLRKLFQEDVLNLLSTTDDDRIQKVCFELYAYNKFTENNKAVLKFLGIPEAAEGGSPLKKVQTNLDSIKSIYGTSRIDVAARSAGDFFDINFAPLMRANPPQELHRLIMGQQAVQIFGMGSPTRQDSLGRFVEIEPVYENFLKEAQARGMNVLYVSYQNWTNSERYRNIPIMELQNKYSCLTAITMARDTHFYEGKEGSNDPLQFASEMHDKFFSSRSKPEETGCYLPDRLRAKYAAESMSFAHKISDLCHPNRALPLTPDVKRAMVALYYNVLTITIMRGENIRVANETCRDGIDRAMGGLAELMEMIEIMNGTESSKEAEERRNKTLFVRAFGARKRAIIAGRVEHYLEVYRVLEQVDPGFTRTRALMHELFGDDMYFMPNALLEAEVR